MQVAEKSVSTFQALKGKIESKTARVGIVGLGYVGLPLAVEFAKAGFHVTGIDLQQSRVDRLMQGESYVQDVPSGEVAQLVSAGRFDATTDFSVVRDLDTINICVPTPLRKTKDPDMSYIVSASDEIAKHFHPGLLVILESTTYPGTTDELLLPTFEKHGGLKVGTRLLSLLLPRAGRSRQSCVSDPEHAKGRRGNHLRLHGDGQALFLAGA